MFSFWKPIQTPLNRKKEDIMMSFLIFFLTMILNTRMEPKRRKSSSYITIWQNIHILDMRFHIFLFLFSYSHFVVSVDADQTWLTLRWRTSKKFGLLRGRDVKPSISINSQKSRKMTRVSVKWSRWLISPCNNRIWHFIFDRPLKKDEFESIFSHES